MTAFETLQRYVGVGLGEHLGYLFTALWTVLVALAVVAPRRERPPLGANTAALHLRRSPPCGRSRFGLVRRGVAGARVEITVSTLAPPPAGA